MGIKAAKQRTPGHEAVQDKGWLRAHQWLLLRRASQVFILLLFAGSPWLAAQTGIWLVKGNLASSLTLDVLPLSDPYVVLQSTLAGHCPATSALTGAAIVLLVYALLGGRMYCSWVCPVNIITDSAMWLRQKLGLKGSIPITRQMRFWILGFTLLLAVLTGTIAWELINPVSIIFRGAVFGMGLAWGMIVAIFILDFAISRRAWCGSLCPVGAFYSLLGHKSLLRVDAWQREKCDDCMDCFLVCPEQHVIKQPLKGGDQGIPSLITSSQCTNCGRCIDVCAEDVFRFTMRKPFSRAAHAPTHPEKLSKTKEVMP